MRTKILFTILLMFIAGTALAAKPSMGVAEFRNDTSAGWWTGGVGRELAGMLTNELAGTGKFKMVERILR